MGEYEVRSPRRGLYQGGQAGFDPGWHHGRVLDLDQLGTPARCATGDVRAQVREHEVRAFRDDRRRGPSHCDVARDYIFRRLALDYLSAGEREDLGVLSTSERLQPTLPEVVEQATPTLNLPVQQSLMEIGDKPLVEETPSLLSPRRAARRADVLPVR